MDISMIVFIVVVIVDFGNVILVIAFSFGDSKGLTGKITPLQGPLDVHLDEICVVDFVNVHMI